MKNLTGVAWSLVLASALAACSSDDEGGGSGGGTGTGATSGSGGNGGSSGSSSGGTAGSGASAGNGGAAGNAGVGGSAGGGAGSGGAAGTSGSAGSSGSSPDGGGPTPCETCLAQKCSSQLAACTGKPACAAIITCVQGCPSSGGDACRTKCVTDNAGGKTEWDALAGCVGTNCTGLCN
ncbi:MAG: hypothetical protein R3B13_35200 [Polyangiaceae bacterium]